MPCNDVVSGDSCNAEVHFYASTDQENETDTDHCSPFCQCFCCHIQIDRLQESNLTLQLFFLAIKRASYSNSVGDEFINLLLQPPQN